MNTEPPRTLHVLFFSIARAAAATEETMIPCAEPLDENGLWNKLMDAHPGLAGLRNRIRLTRNSEFARSGELFKPGDEIALIPPVSGG